MKDIKKIDRFLYKKPELKEIDLLHEEDVAVGVGSLPLEPPPPEGP